MHSGDHRLLVSGHHYGEVDDLGVFHLYVDGVTGNDGGRGTQRRPLKTISAAARKLEDWVAERHPIDGGIEIAAGVYPECVDLRLPNAPMRRVFIRGDVDDMTVLDEGTLTAATAFLLTDAGAAWGTAQAFAALLVRVWDPDDEEGTTQIKTIAMHAATTLIPDEPFSVPPEAGWSYEILEPAVRITGETPWHRGYSPTVSLALWGGPSGAFPTPQGGGPAMLLAWLSIENEAKGFQSCLAIGGGETQIAGVVLRGDIFEACTFANANVYLGGVGLNAEFDPVWGLEALDTGTFYGASLGVRVDSPSGCVGLAARQGSYFFGPYVFVGTGTANFPVFVTSNSYGTLAGGATHAGRNIVGELSALDVHGGGFGADLPFRVRNANGRAGLECRGQSEMTVNAVDFDQMSQAAVAASKLGAFVDVIGPLTKSGGGVDGYGLDAGQGGIIQVAVGGAADITGDLGDVTVDGVAYAAAYGSLPKVGASSGARIYRAV